MSRRSTAHARDIHPLAGKTVRVNLKGKPMQLLIDSCEFRLEDWWINVHGTEWGEAVGNPAALMYGFRAGFAGIPPDNEVVYGKVGPFGYLVHASELGEVVS